MANSFKVFKGIVCRRNVEGKGLQDSIEEIRKKKKESQFMDLRFFLFFFSFAFFRLVTLPTRITSWHKNADNIEMVFCFQNCFDLL